MRNHATLDGLIEWFQTLTPESVGRAGAFYAPDARFVDPFNDVRGPAAIERIFEAMFDELETPAFRVTDCCRAEAAAMLRWRMTFRRGSVAFEIHGTTWLAFDPNGQVCCHEDYWDPAKALFMGIPLLGRVLRMLYSRLSATPKSL